MPVSSAIMLAFRSFAWLFSLSALMSAAVAAPTPAREAVRAGAPIQSHARFCELMTRKLPNVTPALCALAQLQPGPARSVQGGAPTKAAKPGVSQSQAAGKAQPVRGQILTQHTGLPPRAGTAAGKPRVGKPAAQSAGKKR